jgi:ubiquinone/menaquinone biosynthesis C-methylase UbiE
MKEILSQNIKGYDNPQDPEYFFREDHWRRQEIAVQLLSEVVRQEARHQPRLLSLACATGLIEEQIQHKLELEVFGVDGAINALKTARNRGIQATGAEVTRLPFADEMFDYVYAGEIIEHVFNVRHFLSEIERITKPQGSLVITTPNLAKLDDRLKFLFGKTPRQVAHLHPFLYLHIRPFTFQLLKEALETHGFSDLTLRTNAIRVDLGERSLITCSRLLTNLFPKLGATLIVRAKKTGQTYKNLII